MYYDWDRHKNIVDKWKKLFWDVYHSLTDKEFRLSIPLHVKVRIAPCSFVEYKIDTLFATNGFAGEYIKFNLINPLTNKKRVIDVYPQFELKSNSSIIREDVIFEMLLKHLKDEGFYKEEKEVVETETVYV